MMRKIAAVTLAVSFVAMATSGLMMFVIERPSFTISLPVDTDKLWLRVQAKF